MFKTLKSPLRAGFFEGVRRVYNTFENMRREVPMFLVLGFIPAVIGFIIGAAVTQSIGAIGIGAVLTVAAATAGVPMALTAGIALIAWGAGFCAGFTKKLMDFEHQKPAPVVAAPTLQQQIDALSPAQSMALLASLSQKAGIAFPPAVEHKKPRMLTYQPENKQDFTP